MRSFLLLVLLTCLISACSTEKKFTSRKYTSGRYFSHAVHKERREKPGSKKEQILVSSEQKKDKEVRRIAPTPISNEQQAAVEVKISPKKAPELKLMRLIEKGTYTLEKSKLVQTLQKKSTKKNEVSKSEQASAKPAPQSLASVILGGLAFILEIIGFVLAVVSEEYIFLALVGVGCAMGIVALVMGIMGIRQYREDKRNGDKNKLSLVLGIVGTSMGGAAIIAALYFSLYAVIIISGF